MSKYKVGQKVVVSSDRGYGNIFTTISSLEPRNDDGKTKYVYMIPLFKYGLKEDEIRIPSAEELKLYFV